MAVKLVLEFRDETSATRKWTFSNAKSSVLGEDVKALMDTMIANGDIYKYPPKTIAGAKLITTVEEDIDLSD